MHHEAAASKDADMPPTPPDPSWLILQRLDDIRREQDRLYNYIEQRSDRLEHRMDRVEQRMDRLDQRMDRLEQRMDRVEQRMDRLEQRVDRLEQRVERFDQRLDRLTGWFIAGLIAVLGALVGVAFIDRP